MITETARGFDFYTNIFKKQDGASALHLLDSFVLQKYTADGGKREQVMVCVCAVEYKELHSNTYLHTCLPVLVSVSFPHKAQSRTSVPSRV